MTVIIKRKRHNFTNLQEGDELALQKIDSLQHFTEPPARYNDASLVKTLEDEELVDLVRMHRLLKLS